MNYSFLIQSNMPLFTFGLKVFPADSAELILSAGERDFTQMTVVFNNDTETSYLVVKVLKIEYRNFKYKY